MEQFIKSIKLNKNTYCFFSVTVVIFSIITFIFGLRFGYKLGQEDLNKEDIDML